VFETGSSVRRQAARRFVRGVGLDRQLGSSSQMIGTGARTSAWEITSSDARPE